jgi:hypothetical protein
MIGGNMEHINVVARYIDGRIFKGHTRNFSPTRPEFHLYPLGGDTTSEGVKILVKELKALFFVKDFTGNPEYQEPFEVHGNKHPHGHVVEVEFRDGEVLLGTTTGHDLKRPGFFLFPVDPKSNNVKVFVISAAVRTVSAAAKPFSLFER